MSLQIPNELSRFKHYMLGIQELDTEHLEMFALIYNTRGVTNQSVLVRNSEELLQMWKFHAFNESEFMKNIDYPFITFHIVEHKQITNKLEEFCQIKRKNQTVGKYNGFADFGEKFLNHLDSFDQQIYNFIEKQQKK